MHQLFSWGPDMFEAKCTWLTEIDKQLAHSDYKIVAQQMSDCVDEQVMKGIDNEELSTNIFGRSSFWLPNPDRD